MASFTSLWYWIIQFESIINFREIILNILVISSLDEKPNLAATASSLINQLLDLAEDVASLSSQVNKKLLKTRYKGSWKRFYLGNKMVGLLSKNLYLVLTVLCFKLTSSPVHFSCISVYRIFNTFSSIWDFFAVGIYWLLSAYPKNKSTCS